MDLGGITSSLGSKAPKGGGGMTSGIKMPKPSRRMMRIMLRKGGKAGMSGTIPSRASLKGV